MPIGGSATELNITGAKLKVSGGVQVAGSIAYTTDATGFGGVTAQIDGNNTLNVTSGKLTGVAKINRATAATINAITHTNVNNNTTIHIALKNTSSTRGNFITLETFASDDTVKVNYTDDYLIGPGETGMITLRKVDGVLSLFVREMFSDKASTFTNDATDGNRPFYIKDGVNYKYPLYKYSIGGSDLTSIVIGGTTYYRPSAGITTKSRPPKGLPENVVSPTGTLKIGNNRDMTNIEYDVIGVSSNFDFGSITDNGGTTHARFLLTDGEASGTFTESGASSGDSYKLYIDKTDTTVTDTVSTTTQSDATVKVAFHHGAFSASDYSSAYSTVEDAATNGHVYSDTSTTPEYTWGTLGTISSTSTNTTYTWTPPSDITANLLMVAGGGAGGSDNAGGGGGGGLIFSPSTSITGSQTITVGAGAAAVPDETTAGEQGVDTTFGSLTAKGGGCGSNGYTNATPAANMIGGSGGGGDGESSVPTGGATSQSSQSGDSGTYGYGNAGGNGEASQGAGGGGGGAGTSGAHGSSVTNEIGGVGGDGLKEVTIGGTLYNFATVYGAIYGEVLSGESWFAGGGAGGNNNSKTTDVNGGKGGGGKGLGSDDLTDNIIKYGKAHTGGGGGGGTFGTADTYSGGGGSGIVLIKFTGDITTGKTIPKVKDIVLDPTNDSNVLISIQGTGISTVTYKVNTGSEVPTPVSQLSIAHGLSENVTATLLAYALDASSARLGVKLSKSITTVLGYETITLLTKSGSQTITYVDNGTTDVTNTYKSAGGDTWNGGWYMDTGYTAPVTFEYKASASSSDDGNSYKQIGINDSTVQTYAGADTDFDIYHYPYYLTTTMLRGSDVTDENVSYVWNSTDTFYIVYKTNGDVEWWQAGNKIKTFSWGAGKTVYLSTTFYNQGDGSDNGSFKNIRIKRRQWGGTKYIN